MRKQDPEADAKCKTPPSRRADGAFGQFPGPWWPCCCRGKTSPSLGMRDLPPSTLSGWNHWQKMKSVAIQLGTGK